MIRDATSFHLKKPLKLTAQGNRKYTILHRIKKDSSGYYCLFLLLVFAFIAYNTSDNSN